MNKLKKTKSKNQKAEAIFKTSAKKASAKIQEKAKDLILPSVGEDEVQALASEEGQTTSGENITEETKPKINKKKLMLDMLKRPEGASIDELIQATGWQKHSVRGSLVNLKNKDKHPITNSKDEDGPRRYFLKSEETPQAPVSQPAPEGDDSPATEASASGEAA